MPGRATLSLPDLAGDGPAFAEPWQAQVFALTVTLNERAVFTWNEWADALGAALKDAAPDGSDYYQRWLEALETLLIGKNIATQDEVADLTAAWHRAAEATPHGKPILLENDPLAAGRS